MLRRANNEKLTDQVEDGEDELYYGPVTVGSSSPQVFTVDFDTGSADFFVPGPQCTTAKGCKAGTRYNQKGQAEGTTTSVTYGSGTITGNNYLDTVNVAGLTATKTNVISLTSAQGFNTSDSNSLMGMAFSTIANSKQPTFFENLISQKKVSVPEFSFYLGRSASNTQGNSELTLGGTDTSRYKGALTAVPVNSKTYWQVPVTGATASGIKAPLTNGNAAMDTGTTVVIAPLQAAAAIHALIPGAFPVPLVSGSPEELIWAYPCSEKPKVSFILGGHSFAYNPLDFNLGSLTSGFADIIGAESLLSALANPLAGGLCASSIIGADITPVNGASNFYVIGDTFLKNWYSVFSYTGPTVSLAAAVGNQ